MPPSNFDSFDQSLLGGFSESGLGERGSSIAVVNDSSHFSGGFSPFINHGGPLQGVTENNTAIGSFWINPDKFALNGDVLWFQWRNSGGPSAGIGVTLRSGSPSSTHCIVDVRLYIDGSFGVGLQLASVTISYDAWHHLLFAVDSNNVSNSIISHNDSVSLFTGSNDVGNVEASSDFYALGQDYKGCVADWWMKYGSWLDLSVEANRRKFINADLSRPDLGSSGQNPLGSSADVFFSGDFSSNLGSGGTFAPLGAPTICSK